MTLIDPEKILKLLREGTGKDNDEIAVRFRPGSLNPGHHSIYASVFYPITNGENTKRIRIDAALYDTHYDGNPQEYSVSFYSDNTKDIYPAGDPNVEQEITSIIHTSYTESKKFIQNTIQSMRSGEISIDKFNKYNYLIHFVSSINEATDAVYDEQYYPECSFIYKEKYKVDLKYYRKIHAKNDSFNITISSLDTKSSMQFFRVPGKKDVIDIIESHCILLDKSITRYKPHPGHIMSESILIDCGLTPTHFQDSSSYSDIFLTDNMHGPSIKVSICTKFDKVTKNPYFHTIINYYNQENIGISKSFASHLSATSTKKFINNWIKVFQNDYKSQGNDA